MDLEAERRPVIRPVVRLREAERRPVIRLVAERRPDIHLATAVHLATALVRAEQATRRNLVTCRLRPPRRSRTRYCGSASGAVGCCCCR